MTTTASRELVYHRGERFVQENAGEVDQAAWGIGAIHASIPAPAVPFLQERAFIVIAAGDDDGRVWISQLGSEPGFMQAVDERTLRITAAPFPGDPLAPILQKPRQVGTISIDFATHRRMRLNGTSRPTGAGIEITTEQVYANCPKYIAARSIEARELSPDERRVITADRLGGEARDIVANADTFFIGTAFGGGADASHRGGPAGFVQVLDDRNLRWPDYVGNSMFMTLGNITEAPAAGLLFVDWGTGTMVQLTGRASIDWDTEDASRIPGAKRVLNFTIDQSVVSYKASPLRWSPAVPSRFNPPLQSAEDRHAYVDLEVEKVVKESAVISSFYLRRVDGKPLEPWKPGMFLPIRVEVSGEPKPLVRNYTISNAPNTHHYRPSIRRDPYGRVSRHLHDTLAAGSRIKAMPPRGTFVLDRSSDRPIVFLSAGVGITPMLAMVEELLREGRETGNTRPMYFIHGAKDGSVHAFGGWLREAARQNPKLKLHFRYSAAAPDDMLGVTHHSAGYVDGDLVRSLVDPTLCDFYLCGPGPFMQSNFDALVAMGVSESRIHFESFGDATVRRTPTRSTTLEQEALAIPVHFWESGVDAQWVPGLTLLELAESAGLNPAYGCRAGSCGTCATRLASGSVDYIEEPLGPHDDDEVLICCSVPHSTRDSDGVEIRITLAL